MKWLTLVFLFSVVSCGKDHQPKAIDYHDSDGDQVPNYQETDLDRYVANFEALKAVQGKIQFFDKANHEIAFENEVTKIDVQYLLAASDKLLPKKPYFSEWSEAKLTETKMLPDFNKTYHVTVALMSGSDVPDELALENEERSLSLGHCGKTCVLTLAGRDLVDLLSGKLTLKLKKNFKKARFFLSDTGTTIKSETYRVQIEDKGKTETLYVSKKLAIEDFLKLKGLKSCLDLNKMDLFMSPEGDDERCFIRKIRENEFAIGFNNLTNLKKGYFFLNFTLQSQKMERENGKTKTLALNLKNAPGARVLIKVSDITKSINTFVERNESRNYTFGGGALNGNGPERYSCVHHLRAINSASSVQMDVYEFMANVQWVNNGKTYEMNQTEFSHIEEVHKEGQISWEMKFAAAEADLGITLPSLSASSYVTTGEYARRCEGGYPQRSMQGAVSTNPEGKLSFMVETFVEKL